LKFFLLSLFFPLALHAGFHPWGKDASLAKKPLPLAVEREHKSPLLGPLADVLINFHHDVISPSDGPRSHFYPSSSYYTQEAIRTYGFFQGVVLGCDRLMRENKEEWVYTTAFNKEGILRKYDPVP
jgi:putative component of membrane protein insertase Oxa1/YidC/SpoIIIJ protein YidD